MCAHSCEHGCHLQMCDACSDVHACKLPAKLRRSPPTAAQAEIPRQAASGRVLLQVASDLQLLRRGFYKCAAHNGGTRVQQQGEASSGGERKRMRSGESRSGSVKQYSL